MNSLVSIFAELDVRIDRQRHKEDQNCIKQDQPRLGNVGVIWFILVSHIGRPDVSARHTEKDYDRRKSSNNSRVSTLMHDIVHNRNRQTAQNGWQGTHSPVWDIISRVAVSNVLEVEVALKTNKPSCKSEQQLRKWGMDVEIVLATEIVCGKLAKMDLIEAVAGEKLVARVLRR